MNPPAVQAVMRGDNVLWYLGPSALALGVTAFVIIVLMAIFGAGSVLVWLRRGGRVVKTRERASSRPGDIRDTEVRKIGS